MIRPGTLGDLMAGCRPTNVKPYKYSLAAGAALYCAGLSEPGVASFVLFVTWAVVCAIASARRDLTVWVVTTFGPLSLIAALWPGEIASAGDLQGVILSFFLVMCLVAGMTCVLALVGPYAERDNKSGAIN